MSIFSKKQQDPFEGKVKCIECKHYIDKMDAQVVAVEWSFVTDYYYYCSMHKQPYDVRSFSRFGISYYKKLEVTQTGEPVGYEKIKHEVEKNDRKPRKQI